MIRMPSVARNQHTGDFYMANAFSQVNVYVALAMLDTSPDFNR
jgi:hypothetical protein